jgi:hypothetical protein
MKRARYLNNFHTHEGRRVSAQARRQVDLLVRCAGLSILIRPRRDQSLEAIGHDETCEARTVFIEDPSPARSLFFDEITQSYAYLVYYAVPVSRVRLPK